MTRRIAELILWIGVSVVFLFAAPAHAEHRIALVVGNSHYLNTPALANPENDARDVGEALKSLGFDVRLQIDASKNDFDRALESFARDARSADAALVYYAGHGLQYHGKNYLMPVDAALKDDVSLRYEMVEGADVVGALQESPGVKIMILDACRDNPLAKRLARSIVASSRGTDWAQGLARPERINGMIVVYATQADEVAHDGEGRNSPFAAAFLKALKTPGLEVGALFRRVEADVVSATDGEQSPELSISLAPEFYINTTDTDQTVWARLRAAPDAPSLREFIRRYPASFFTPDAEARLKMLEGAPAPIPPAAKETPLRPVVEPTPVAVVAPPVAATPSAPPTPVAIATGAAEPARTVPQIASLETPVARAIARPPDYRSRIDAELRRLGCTAPGVALPQSLGCYARVARISPPTEMDAALVADLGRRPAHFCTPACGVMEMAVDGRCLRKICPPNRTLAPTGACVSRVVRQPKPPEPVVQAEPQPRRAPKPAASHSAPCLTFGGNRICD